MEKDVKGWQLIEWVGYPLPDGSYTDDKELAVRESGPTGNIDFGRFQCKCGKVAIKNYQATTRKVTTCLECYRAEHISIINAKFGQMTVDQKAAWSKLEILATCLAQAKNIYLPTAPNADIVDYIKAEGITHDIPHDVADDVPNKAYIRLINAAGVANLPWQQNIFLPTIRRAIAACEVIDTKVLAFDVIALFEESDFVFTLRLLCSSVGRAKNYLQSHPKLRARALRSPLVNSQTASYVNAAKIRNLKGKDSRESYLKQQQANRIALQRAANRYRRTGKLEKCN